MLKPNKATWLIPGGLLILWLTGCSSIPLQSSSLLKNPPADLQSTVELTTTPFNPQLEYQCGPSSLATLLQSNGLKVQANELTPQVYLPKRQGSLQIELVAAARRYDLLPYVIEPKLVTLLNEVQAGNPVLVMQNLGLSWAPQWHYAVVIGYDLHNDKVILRSGTDKRHINSFSLFEKTWQRGDYWGLVTMPLDKLPATASPFRYLSSAVAFEKLGKLQQAKTAYATALTRWPDDKHLLMASGNIHYKLNYKSQAESFYRKVIKLWPTYAPALNNLANIKLSYKQYDEAEMLIQRAIKSGGPFIKEYQATLDKILKEKQTSN